MADVRSREPLPPADAALFLPTLGGGGAERVTLNLARGLHARGHRIELVVGTDEGAYRDLVPEGVPLMTGGELVGGGGGGGGGVSPGGGVPPPAGGSAGCESLPPQAASSKASKVKGTSRLVDDDLMRQTSRGKRRSHVRVSKTALF